MVPMTQAQQEAIQELESRMVRVENIVTLDHGANGEWTYQIMLRWPAGITTQHVLFPTGTLA